jgi:SprT protein
MLLATRSRLNYRRRRKTAHIVQPVIKGGAFAVRDAFSCSCQRGRVLTMKIVPIDVSQQEQVREATQVYVERARVVFDYPFKPVPVTFDLTGRAAGMYKVDRRRRVIRYNPYIFAKYFEDSLSVTVPHEVAHYVTDIMFGLRNIRPHGREWGAVMHALGAEAVRTANYDLEGVPVRRQRRHAYRCACTEHQLTSRRHNLVQSARVRYLCRRCGGELLYENLSQNAPGQLARPGMDAENVETQRRRE